MLKNEGFKDKELIKMVYEIKNCKRKTKRWKN